MNRCDLRNALVAKQSVVRVVDVRRVTPVHQGFYLIPAHHDKGNHC